MSDRKRPPLDPDVERYYREVEEENRLRHGPSRIEFARTREVVRERLPGPPAVVLDVGGAAGDYSLWLALEGYEVHLVEPVERLVEEAKRRSAKSSRPIASCRVGDARALDLDDAGADAVLLLGPLYHLTEASERSRALREAHRVLKPGGTLFAAAISRYASALDGLFRDLLADPAFRSILERDLETGQHRNPTGDWDYFTTSYFHETGELHDEVAAAGFDDVRVLGLEGPAWLLPDIEDRWRDDRRRNDLLQTARWLESEPSIVGASAHLMAVAVR